MVKSVIVANKVIINNAKITVKSVIVTDTVIINNVKIAVKSVIVADKVIIYNEKVLMRTNKFIIGKYVTDLLVRYNNIVF